MIEHTCNFCNRIGENKCDSCYYSILLDVAGKGCEHCLTEYDREDWRDGNPHEMRIEGNNLFTYSTSDGWEGAEIRFCPWCGRYLQKDYLIKEAGAGAGKVASNDVFMSAT